MTRTHYHGKELILRDDFEKRVAAIHGADPSQISMREAEEYVRQRFEPHDYPVLPKDCEEHEPESTEVESGFDSRGAGTISYQTVHYCGNCGVTLVAETDEDGTYWMEAA